MDEMRKFIPILCVTLGLGVASAQSDAHAGERIHGVGFCDVIQHNDSPCVLVNAAPETRQSKSVGSYVSLEKGLTVPVRLAKAVHSRDVQSHTFGQRVDLEVANDVVIDGLVVIAAGTEAWGFLGESSKRPGRFFTDGYLQIMAEGTRAVTGEIVPLSGYLEVAGVGNACGDDGSGGCALGFLLLGPFVKGSDAEVRRDTYISAQVADALLLDRTVLERTPVVPRVGAELQHAIQAGKGLVIAYRLPDDGCRAYESKNGGPFRPVSCGKAHLTIDATSATALTAGHLLQFELDPGQHRFHTPNGDELSVTVSSGSVQYIRINVSRWKRHTQLGTVSTEIGEAESSALEKTSSLMTAPEKTRAEL